MLNSATVTSYFCKIGEILRFPRSEEFHRLISGLSERLQTVRYIEESDHQKATHKYDGQNGNDWRNVNSHPP